MGVLGKLVGKFGIVSFPPSFFFPFFGRDFVGSRKFDAWPTCYEAIRNSWEGIVSDDFRFYGLEISSGHVYQKGNPKNVDNLKNCNLFNDIFILKFHKRREPSKFLLGGHVIVSKKQWDLQIPWGTRNTKRRQFPFFHPNIQSFRRQVLNCQLHVGLAPTEFTISEVGSIDDVRCGVSRVSRNGIRPFLIKGSQAWVKFFFSGETTFGVFSGMTSSRKDKPGKLVCHLTT